MTDKLRGMVLASFVGDALSLGAHWIYDTDVIKSSFGRVENFLPPSPGSYHANKKKGDFTHYGDQTLVLLRSISQGNRFDLSLFGSNWQEFIRSYEGYLDKASKTTLANFDDGKDCFNSGSSSNDLGGAARIAPLLYHYRSDLETTLSYAREQTAMTHNSTAAIIAADFLCRVTWVVLDGASPREAIEQELANGIEDITVDMRIRNVLEEQQSSTTSIIKQCGQACDAMGALPAVVHLVTKYSDNLQDALIENVMAGGDSAARGLAAGMILGAHLGQEAIPKQWLEDMISAEEVLSLLK